MFRFARFILLTLFVHLVFTYRLTGQWTLNGTAFNLGGNCFRMTQQLNAQIGSVWNNTPLNLSQPFDISFWVRINGGADGVTFTLQNNPANPLNASGLSGGGIGYQTGVSPAVTFEVDIWDNGAPTDLPIDHVAIHLNGTNNAFAGPIQADPATTNVGDNVCRKVRVTWDPATLAINMYFNNSLRITTTLDMVANVFGGNPNVFWGFTGSTGGVNAEQIICLEFANAGNDTATCYGVPLNLNAGTGNAYTWQTLPGNGAPNGLSCPNCNNPVFNPGTFAPSYTYRLEVTNTYGCIDDDTIVLSLAPAPTASNAGPNQTICSATATLAANTPGVGTGQWTVVSGTGSFTNPSNPSTTVTGLSTGANVLRWTISSGNCVPSSSTVTLNVDAQPSPAQAGPDRNICTATATLAATPPATGAGSWSIVSGGGFVVSPSNPGTNVNGLSVGPHVFEWVTVNGTCPPSRDSVTLTVDPQPTPANAGPDQFICNSPTATLAANTPVTGTGIWTRVGGNGTVTSPSNPNSGVTGLTTGANTFQWTITSGTCPPVSDQVIIQIDPLPTPPFAGPDQTLCAGTTNLAGNNPINGTGQWNRVSGTGNITSPSSAGSGVTGLVVGNASFEWVITSGVCPPSRDTMNITIDPYPTPSNAGPDQRLCDVTTTSLGGNLPVFGTGAWSLISGTGALSLASDPQSSVTGLTAGSLTLQWTIINGTCPPSRDTVVIVVDALPTTAAAGPDQVFCAASTNLAGNTPASGTGLWTFYSGNGTLFNPTNAQSNVSGLTPGTYMLQWTISNGVCPPSADSVVLTVDENPTPANAGPDQVLCNASAATLAANAATVGTGQWTILSGSGVISMPTDPASGVTGLAPGQAFFHWTTTNGTCPPSSDQVMIQVDPLPSTANAGADIRICDNQPLSLNGNGPLSGTGVWTGPGSIASPSSPTTNVGGLNAGNYVFTWTISSGVCPSSTDNVAVTIIETPFASFTADTLKGCVPLRVIFANTSTTGNSFTWDFGDGNNAMANAPGNSANIYQNAGVFSVTLIADNQGCTDTVTQSNLISTANVPVAHFDAGVDIPGSITSGTEIQMDNLSLWSDSWEWDFGDAGASTLFEPSHEYVQLGNYCITLRAISSFGCENTETQCTLEVMNGNMFFPNAFSPNDDGLNDLFLLTTNINFSDFHLMIFDRWGKQIWESLEPAGWNGKFDGKQLPEGVYTWTFAGTTLAGTKLQRSGTVTLLR